MIDDFDDGSDEGYGKIVQKMAKAKRKREFEKRLSIAATILCIVVPAIWMVLQFNGAL